MKRYLGLTNPMRLIAVGIVGFLAALASLAANAAEEETFEVYTTPKGTYRLELRKGLIAWKPPGATRRRFSWC